MMSEENSGRISFKLKERRTMQLVTFLPPLIQRLISAPDKGERRMVYLAIKRCKCLVYLSYNNSYQRRQLCEYGS
jgi:hypothetical protein